MERPEVKRPLGKVRRKWKYNIKINLQEVGWREVEWICLAKGKNR